MALLIFNLNFKINVTKKQKESITRP